MVAPPPTPSVSPSTSSAPSSRSIPVWVVVLVAVILTPLVVGGGVVGWFWDDIFATDSPQPRQQSSGQRVDDEIKREFDLDSADFYTVDEYSVPDQKVTLRDGKHYPDGGSGDDPHTEVMSKPVFSDMDADGDLDASAVLASSGEEAGAGWQDVFVWLWEDGKAQPMKWSAMWQLDCLDSDLKIAGDETEAGLKVRRVAENICDNDSGTETIKVVVKDGLAVREHDDGNLGATQSCWKADPNVSLYADMSGSEPTLAPTEGASKVDTDGVSKVEAHLIEDWDPKNFDSFAYVLVTRDDGTESCGWLPWADVESKLS